MDDTNTESVEREASLERFAALDAGDGVVIYDRSNHRAWIQASDPVHLTEYL